MVSISNNNLPNLQSLFLNSASSASSLLKVGQVLSVNIDQVQGKQVLLNIAGQTITATSKESLQNTGTVQVQVKQLQPTLELVIIKSPKQTASQQLQQTLQAAYRQFIPNQQAIPQVLQQISLMQALPPSLSGAINQLLDQVSKSNTPLSGKELKDKISNSGLFLESKLNKSDKPNVNTDLKAQLLKLNQETQSLNSKSFSPQLAQLAGTLTQAINRLTVQQLQLYETPYITAMELPYESNRTINESSIELRKHNEKSAISWEVLINIALPQGEMATKIILNQQDELSYLIWCETDALELLVSENLENLKQQLSDGELGVRSLQIVKQKPIKTEKTTQIALIDIHI
ncbi:MAG: hypothetical protein ISEC1_P0127 [Thiomicrorhabdus sp.]|nr:MAG: hypothetical protein ISEC1_P0127 [Thiomicrorhabdus sp.]